MTVLRIMRGVVAATASVIAMTGCTAPSGVAGSAAGQNEGVAEQRQTSAGSYLYFRCNATGWNVDDATRLVAGDNPEILELTYEVREPYMTSSGDDCVLTETPEKNRWGDWQKYHGLAVYSPVPALASYYVKEPAAGENGYFHLVYPERGRYRVLVNWRERYVSVRKESVAPGETLWTLPGPTTAGKAGDLYHLSSPPDRASTLSRIGEDGKPRWITEVASPSYFNDGCFYSDGLVLRDGDALVGVDPATGSKRWRTSPRPGEEAIYPSCPAEGPRVFTWTTTYTDGNLTFQEIRAIDRHTGATAWSYARTATPGAPSLPYESIVYAGPDYVVLSRYENEAVTYRTLSADLGQELWTITLQGYTTYLTFDDRGRPYRVTNDEPARIRRIEQLDPRTGQTKWVYDADEDTWVSPWIEGGLVHVRLQTKLLRLDPSAGDVLWTLRFPEGAQYPSTTLLPSGDVVVVVSNYEEKKANVSYVEGATGHARWAHTYEGEGYATLEQDPQRRLYVRIANTMKRVDEASGAELWSFTYTPSSMFDTLAGVFSADAGFVYLRYAIGYRYATIGLFKLDVHTGAQVWKTPTLGIGLRLVRDDSDRLYYATGFYGPGSGRVLLK